jgi:hypothetical protein
MTLRRVPLPRLGAIVALTTLAAGPACGGDSTDPSPPPVTIGMPASVEGRLVTCDSCAEPTVTVIVEFDVVVRDPLGPGGTLQRLETVVTNRSRASEVARNARPNASFTFPDRTIPPRGQLTVQAGVGFAPPPPRDEIVVGVEVTLTDGRTASASSPLVIPGT